MKNKSDRLCVRITNEERSNLLAYASNHNSSASNIIRDALKSYLTENSTARFWKMRSEYR
jgi:metal-responsive CopG/Arc/MetJ family transcriptional regulator